MKRLKKESEVPNEEEFHSADTSADINNDMDPEKIIAYGELRKKFYYAIIECDTPATASELYEQCNEREVEFAGIVMFLRYVPQEMNFDEENVSDHCHTLPLEYVLSPALSALQTHERILPSTGETSGMSNTPSAASLLWDMTDLKRTAALKNAFAMKDMQMGDLDAYVASESEESQVTMGRSCSSQKEKYACLLEGYQTEDKDHDNEKDLQEDGSSTKISSEPYIDELESVSSEVSKFPNHSTNNGDFYTEFTAHDDAVVEKIHEESMYHLALQNVKTVGERRDVKRKAQRQKQRSKTENVEETETRVETPCSTEDLKTIIRNSNLDTAESPDRNFQKNNLENTVDSDEQMQDVRSENDISKRSRKRRLHKQKKQAQARENRIERQARRLARQGLQFQPEISCLGSATNLNGKLNEDTPISSIDMNRAAREIGSIDERFSHRMKESMYHVDIGKKREKVAKPLRQ